MLSEILKAFEESKGPMDLKELSRQLGTEPSALGGMLGLLVRQGKLREIKPGSEVCRHCSSRSSCGHLQSGKLMGTVYELSN